MDVHKADVDKALCVLVNVPYMRAPCLRVSIMRACPAPSYTCLAHTCAQVLFACGCHASFACLDLRSRIFAYSLLGGCAHASLNMWVHAYCFCAIYSKRWALISFSGICVLVIALPHQGGNNWGQVPGVYLLFFHNTGGLCVFYILGVYLISSNNRGLSDCFFIFFQCRWFI